MSYNCLYLRGFALVAVPGLLSSMKIKKSRILLLSCLPVLAACVQGGRRSAPDVSVHPDTAEVRSAVRVDSSFSDLVFYYPRTDSIVLRCFDRPEPLKDPDIVFCCAAAFSGGLETTASHSRICSAHVSGGRYYPKPRISRYTGAFVSYGGSWAFLYDKGADPAAFEEGFREAALAGGAGFAQEMMIHGGRQVPTTRPPGNTNLFRAMCVRGRGAVHRRCHPLWDLRGFCRVAVGGGGHGGPLHRHGKRLELLMVPDQGRRSGHIHPPLLPKGRHELAGVLLAGKP